jgi:hypothetical protein
LESVVCRFCELREDERSGNGRADVMAG